MHSQKFCMLQLGAPSNVNWFVKTIFYYLLDGLHNEQHETKSVTEGVRRKTGVTLFANLQATTIIVLSLSVILKVYIGFVILFQDKTSFTEFT